MRKSETYTLAGHLINEAYELAEAAAELAVGEDLVFRAMTGFKFVHSPGIPGVVRFTARLAGPTVRLGCIWSARSPHSPQTHYGL